MILTSDTNIHLATPGLLLFATLPHNQLDLIIDNYNEADNLIRYLICYYGGSISRSCIDNFIGLPLTGYYYHDQPNGLIMSNPFLTPQL